MVPWVPNNIRYPILLPRARTPTTSADTSARFSVPTSLAQQRFIFPPFSISLKSTVYYGQNRSWDRGGSHQFTDDAHLARAPRGATPGERRTASSSHAVPMRASPILSTQICRVPRRRAVSPPPDAPVRVPGRRAASLSSAVPVRPSPTRASSRSHGSPLTRILSGSGRSRRLLLTGAPPPLGAQGRQPLSPKSGRSALTPRSVSTSCPRRNPLPLLSLVR